MNNINEILVLLVTFLAGGIIGFIIYHMTLGKKKANTQQQELDQNKAELEQYKSKVNDHFTNSADLMEQVASSYQALYSHMASQSQSLLSDEDESPFPMLKTPDIKAQEKRLSASEDDFETNEEIIFEEYDLSADDNASRNSDTTPDSSDKDKTDTVADNNDKTPDSSDKDKIDTAADNSDTTSDSSDKDKTEKATDSGDKSKAMDGKEDQATDNKQKPSSDKTTK